ncbi:MAG: chorismate synthase [Methanoculleus sp. SDB]|nr:MAG: chorismate synthase [Methanoculleus sp. SDB]
MNTFGKNFRCTTFGESHGPALGAVVDGCPPGIAFSEDDIRPLLDRRRPGTGPRVSSRQESDEPLILSGIFDGVTTGTPVAIVVYNRDQRSGDYDALRDIYRPGHADFTYRKKYGIRDYRGGGRSSGRETVARVCAGALAMKLLAQRSILVHGRAHEIHGATTEEGMEEEIRQAQGAEDSVGGIIEITASGCPAGLGDPVFGKLDARIAAAMMSIGAVKGVEIGDGFAAARMHGSEHNDEMGPGGFLTNHCGGILGGISTGTDIIVRIAVKPTPSIARSQRTIDTEGRETVISVTGRHDPCIVPRAIPVAESMLALVLADAVLEQEKNRMFSQTRVPR